VKVAGAKFGVTPPILHLEFFSCYSLLYEVRHCHAAGMPKRQQSMTVSSNCWHKLILKDIIVPFAVYCVSLLQVMVILQIL